MPTQDQYESYDKQVRELTLDLLSYLCHAGRHPKIQGHWRRFKNRHDPTGKMPEIGLDYIENRRTQVCEVWQTGSVWATWLETKRGKRWAFRRGRRMTTSWETWPMCGQRLKSSEKSQFFQANTQLIRDAAETMEFNSIEQLEQALLF